MNKHASLKSKVTRRKKKPFVTQTVRKAIMRRSVLKNKANTLNDSLAMILYKKLRC